MKCSRTHSVYVLKAIQWCELELEEQRNTRSFETLEFWVWRTQDSYELTYGNSNCENGFFWHIVFYMEVWFLSLQGSTCSGIFSGDGKLQMYI